MIEDRLELKSCILRKLRDGSLKPHAIEAYLKEQVGRIHSEALEVAVEARRQFYEISEDLMYRSFPYEKVNGACCENVIGFVGVPVGLAGPLLIDGKLYEVPLATLEGALVASTNRGCKAVSACGGVKTIVTGKGMTRGPFIKLSSILRAEQVKLWIRDHYDAIKEAFEGTSRHLKLLELDTKIAGYYLFLRFKGDTGEAMGMNMLSKGTDAALKFIITTACPDALYSCLSGNFCTDKKAGASLNWTSGRGYSVVAEAQVSKEVLSSVLKVGSAGRLAELATAKNLIGSAVASVAAGGQNAHAANLVAAIFLATGQDMAQVVESSACLTVCEEGPDGSLVISLTMPCMEVGVIGGGTGLQAQASMISRLTEGFPEGQKAERLARVIASTVLTGELSLLASLASDTLVSAHLALNRAKSSP